MSSQIIVLKIFSNKADSKFESLLFKKFQSCQNKVCWSYQSCLWNVGRDEWEGEKKSQKGEGGKRNHTCQITNKTFTKIYDIYVV